MHSICAKYAQKWRIGACEREASVLAFPSMAAGTPETWHGTTVADGSEGAYRMLIRPVGRLKQTA